MKLLPAFTGTPESNKVYNVTAEVMLSALPTDSIDLIVTSPPYDNLRTYKGFTWDFEYIARQSYRVLKPGGVLVWVVGDSSVEGSETLTAFEQALYFKKSVGFRVHDTMIYRRQGKFPESNRYWQDFEYMFVLSKQAPTTFNPLKEKSKNGIVSVYSTERQADGTLVLPKNERTTNGTKDLSNVWDISSGFMLTTKDVEAYQHPAMFPESLAERHILSWSNHGDVVLDYFGGSGTVAKMARNTGRQFLTNDISREYCDLMERRLAAPYTPSFMPMLAG